MISSIEKLDQNIISHGCNKDCDECLPSLLVQDRPKETGTMEVEMAGEENTSLEKPLKPKTTEIEAERRARWQLRKEKERRRRKERIALREAEAAEEQAKNRQKFRAVNDEQKLSRPPIYFAALQKALREKEICKEQRVQKSRNGDKTTNLPVDIWAALREVSRKSVPNGTYGHRSKTQIMCRQKSTSCLLKSQPVQSLHDSGGLEMKPDQNIWEALREKARRHFPNGVSSQRSKSLSPDIQLPHQRIRRKSPAAIRVGLSESIDAPIVAPEQPLYNPEELSLKGKNCLPDIAELTKLATRLGFGSSVSQKLSSAGDFHQESSVVNLNAAKDRSQITHCLPQRAKLHFRTEEVPAKSTPPAVKGIPFDSACTSTDWSKHSASVPEEPEERRPAVDEPKDMSTRVLNPFRRQQLPPGLESDIILKSLSSSLHTKRRFQDSSLPASSSDKSCGLRIKRRKTQEEDALEVTDLSH